MKPVALIEETKTATQLPPLRAQPALVVLKLEVAVLAEPVNVLVIVMVLESPTVTV